MASGTDSFTAKNGSEFSFQSIGDIGVVCSIANQNGKGFLFPAFSFNGDDDASWSCTAQTGQQEVRQQEWGEVIHREAQFVAILTELTRAGAFACPDSCIVDQQVEPSLVSWHFLGQAMHLGKLREIGEVGF